MLLASLSSLLLQLLLVLLMTKVVVVMSRSSPNSTRLSRCFLNTQRCLLLRSELEESRVLREKDKLRYEVMLREAEGEKGKLLRQVRWMMVR